ncbi:MAG: cellulase family glycosylhydrolase [Ardenticatenaceae bacterium]|nr:cellulase family glycosylhydrolase [Ardenticatenaceae bacterium]MCB9445457.1 cellulase family glycosylhydrolase [Ardenticatenaceae bacterium]
MIILIFVLLLWGCQEPDGAAIPTVVNTAVPPTISPTNTPVSSDSNQTFLPLASSSAEITPTPLPTPVPTATLDYPIYTGAPIKRADFGVQVHIQQEDLRPIIDQLRELGVGWVKVQVSWKLFQPYADQYSADRFAELDEFVRRANDAGIAILLSVSKAPEWSRPTTEMDGPPSDFGLYREFMATLAERYRGRVAAYELWNEANLQREWSGGSVRNGRTLNAADFVNLIREGAAGVRAADTDAILISGAPATTGVNDGLVAIDDRVFLRQMLEAGVADFVDAIGAHPYGWANPPDSSVNDGDTAVPTHNDHPSFFFKDTLNDYAALLAEFGLADMPIWVTEFGWGSFDGFDVPPPAGAEFMANVTEWQQAVYILRAYELANKWEEIGPMFLWNLNFGPLLGNQFSESGYSLLRPDDSQRPAFKALVHLPKE